MGLLKKIKRKVTSAAAPTTASTGAPKEKTPSVTSAPVALLSTETTATLREENELVSRKQRLEDEIAKLEARKAKVRRVSTKPSRDAILPRGVTTQSQLQQVKEKTFLPDTAFTAKTQPVTRFINKHVPPRACSSCNISSQCPMFKPSYSCAFTGVIEEIDIRDRKGLKAALMGAANLLMQRAQFGVIEEQVTGNQSKLLEGSLEAMNKVVRSIASLEEREYEESRMIFEAQKPPQDNILVALLGISGDGSVKKRAVNRPRPVIEVDYTNTGLEEDFEALERARDEAQMVAREKRKELMSEVSKEDQWARTQEFFESAAEKKVTVLEK